MRWWSGGWEGRQAKGGEDEINIFIATLSPSSCPTWNTAADDPMTLPHKWPRQVAASPVPVLVLGFSSDRLVITGQEAFLSLRLTTHTFITDSMLRGFFFFHSPRREREQRFPKKKKTERTNWRTSGGGASEWARGPQVTPLLHHLSTTSPRRRPGQQNSKQFFHNRARYRWFAGDRSRSLWGVFFSLEIWMVIYLSKLLATFCDKLCEGEGDKVRIV